MPSKLDSRDLEALYRDSGSDLRSYVSRRLGSSRATEADDIVQESFLRVSSQSGDEPVGNPRGFLFRTARNLIIDLARKRRVREEKAQTLDATLAGRGERPTPEQEVGSQQDLELIMAAIDELPPACRRVFLMQRRHSLSYAAIARELGISESMVQKHMSKALCHLYKVLP